MDLSTPLAAITPTLDAGVLGVLAATTAPCTAAEVHRRLGRGSDEGVRKVLARLVEQGIVVMEIPARYPVYRLNREHVAAGPIVQLSRLREEIIDRLRSELADWSIAPAHAGLFGSFARGEADSESDIDVLVVRPAELDASDEEAWSDQVDRLAERVQAWTGNAAQIVDVDQDTLREMILREDPLVESWRFDDITLAGASFRGLTRAVR